MLGTRFPTLDPHHEKPDLQNCSALALRNGDHVAISNHINESLYFWLAFHSGGP